MKRLIRIILLASAAVLALAGIVNAGKPTSGGTPAGQAWAHNSDLNPIALGGSPAVISQLNLPDGKFVINATVEVVNTDFSNDVIVLCQLRFGLTGGGTVLDFSEVKLPASTATGYADTKIALTGVLDKNAPPAGVFLHVTCSSTGAASANWGNLNAVSVSALTMQ